MPLEIEIDTKKKNGLFKSFGPIEKIDEFSRYIAERPETARPLSIVEGLKFAKQAYYDGDSVNYTTPTEFDMPLLGKYLKQDKKRYGPKRGGLNKMLQNFIDSSKREARISVSMKDIEAPGPLPLMNSIRQRK